MQLIVAICVMLEGVVDMTKPKCLACDEVKCKGIMTKQLWNAIDGDLSRLPDMKYRGFGQTTCQCRCHEIIKYYEESK